MTRKRTGWICCGLIGMLLLCMGVLWTEKPVLEGMSGIVAISENMTCYIVNNSGKNPVIYEIDSTGKILNFCKSKKEKEKSQKIVQLIWNSEGISYLKELEGQDGEISYRLYTNSASLKQECLQGEFTLETGEKILNMTGTLNTSEIVSAGRGNSRIRVYRISHSREQKNEKLSLETISEITALEQEWFCDAAYYNERTYILDNRGRMTCYRQTQKEENEEFNSRQITRVTANRAGLFCEHASGELELYTDAGFQKIKNTKNMAAMDAVSSKANVQMVRDAPGHIQLKLYQSDGMTKTDAIYMEFGVCIRYCQTALLAAAGIGVAVWVLAWLGWEGLRRQRQTVLRAVAAACLCQVVLGLILAGGIAAGIVYTTEAQQEKMGLALAFGTAEELQAMDFTAINVEGMIQTGFYKTLKTAVTERTITTGKGNLKTSAMVVSAGNISEKEAVTVIAAADYVSGRNLYGIATVQLLQILQQARNSAEIQSAVLKPKRDTVLVVMPLGERIVPETFLITEVKASGSETVPWQAAVLLWMAAESLLCVGLVLYQRSRVSSFVQAVKAAVEGEKRDTLRCTEDFHAAWVEIQKQLVVLERKRAQQFGHQAAYDRFIPIRFAELLGHHDIGEVAIGEVRRVHGTVIHVLTKQAGASQMEDSTYIYDISALLELFKKEGAEGDGVILPDVNEPGSIRILYENQAKRAVSMVLGVWQQLNRMEDVSARMGATFLLHDTAYICGVTGTEEQAFPFAAASGMELLKKYTRLLQRAQVRMTVTEEMLPYLREGQKYRYIGYVPGEEKKKVYRFYEILDVYSEKERERRCQMMGKFDQALKLFYQNDFYLARLMFTEILKECPKDPLATRYLFICERMFHMEEAEEITHYLFELD